QPLNTITPRSGKRMCTFMESRGRDMEMTARSALEVGPEHNSTFGMDSAGFPPARTQPSEGDGDNDPMSRIRTGPQGPGGSARTGQRQTGSAERPNPEQPSRTHDHSAFEGSRPTRGPALLPPPHAGGTRGVQGSNGLRAIAAVPDAGARNRAMVQTWTRLSEGLARHLGRQDATWPTFAGWAGAGLGCVARGEEPVGPELEAHREELVRNAL